MERFSRRKQACMSATALSKMIYLYRDDELCETDSLRQALKPEAEEPRGQRPVISVVGAGGKTTTLHRLADEYVRAGVPVIVTTTTHIMREDREYFLPGFSEEKIREQLKKTGQVWVGKPASCGKLGKLSDTAIENILKWGFPVLIEADGAKRMPAKVPAEHEPVILPCTTHVLSVYGLDSIGKKIEDVVFHPELAEKLLNKKKNECVSEKDIAILAGSVYAGRKGCPEKAGYTVVLNKADNETQKRTALGVCRALKERGIRQVIVTGRK